MFNRYESSSKKVELLMDPNQDLILEIKKNLLDKMRKISVEEERIKNQKISYKKYLSMYVLEKIDEYKEYGYFKLQTDDFNYDSRYIRQSTSSILDDYIEKLAEDYVEEFFSELLTSNRQIMAEDFWSEKILRYCNR